MDLISNISNSISLVKRLKEISQNVKEAEFKNLLADLSLELADFKLKLAEQVDEVSELKTKNSKLREQIENLEKATKNDSLEFKNNVYFKFGDDDPFCTGCYDNRGKLSRLSKTNDHFSHFGTHECPVCQSFYSVGNDE